MTFKQLYEEAAARGFDDMLRDPAQLFRLKRWVNDAHREICDLADWPFLEGTAEGTAPLAIEDLGHVLSVSAPLVEGALRPLDRRRVVDLDPGLDDTGAAEYWYREGMATIKTHPIDAGSIFVVRYVRAVVELVKDEDEPLPPAAYHSLTVDGTVVRCMKNRKNYEAAQYERQEWERGIKGMEHALLKPNHDREKRVARTGSGADYLG